MPPSLDEVVVLGGVGSVGGLVGSPPVLFIGGGLTEVSSFCDGAGGTLDDVEEVPLVVVGAEVGFVVSLPMDEVIWRSAPVAKVNAIVQNRESTSGAHREERS